MKNLLNLKGAKALNKKEQQAINGGGVTCWGGHCFPSEGKCNHYCGGTCSPCGPPSGGYTPHICSDPCGIF